MWNIYKNGNYNNFRKKLPLRIIVIPTNRFGLQPKYTLLQWEEKKD
jgi:hypothetical protein